MPIISDELRLNAFISAIREGKNDFALLEIENGMPINFGENAPTGSIPLMVAITSTNETIFNALLERGVDVNFIDASKNNALTYVIDLDSQQSHLFSPTLIAKGCNIHHRDQLNMTPLMIAAKWGDIGTVNMLLETGEDFSDEISPSLYRAIKNHGDNGGDYPAVIDRLLALNADVNIVVNGETPLEAAVKNDDFDFVRLLLERGATPHVVEGIIREDIRVILESCREQVTLNKHIKADAPSTSIEF